MEFPLRHPARVTLDARLDRAFLNEVVLSRWAKRCGEACAARWNELVGSRYGLVAKAN